MFVQSLLLTLLGVSSGLAQSCNTPQGSGTCLDTASCSTFSVPGFCAGGASNQCCVQRTCNTAQGSGVCRKTTKPCTGTFVSGACPGDATIKCCVTGANPGASGIPAIDISTSKTTAFWNCAKASSQKVIIRGYRQACGSGGGIDSSLLGSYNAARTAGFTNIDVYFFPCTGTQPNGMTCKNAATQFKEMENYISNNNMNIGHIWLDIEPTSGACNAWNLGAAANTALAKQYTAMARTGKYKWGIYANANQWAGMFGNQNVDVGSDLPFWAVQFDSVPGVNTVTRFCGGWTKAYAKQYKLDAAHCGSTVDFNSFLG